MPRPQMPLSFFFCRLTLFSAFISRGVSHTYVIGARGPKRWTKYGPQTRGQQTDRIAGWCRAPHAFGQDFGEANISDCLVLFFILCRQQMAPPLLYAGRGGVSSTLGGLFFFRAPFPSRRSMHARPTERDGRGGTTRAGYEAAIKISDGLAAAQGTVTFERWTERSYQPFDEAPGLAYPFCYPFPRLLL